MHKRESVEITVRIFSALVERMKQKLLKFLVTQSDETTTQVISNDCNERIK